MIGPAFVHRRSVSTMAIQKWSAEQAIKENVFFFGFNGFCMR